MAITSITPDRILTPGGWLADVTLRAVDGRIVEIVPAAPDAVRQAGSLLPGFVDSHVHGGGGAAFTDADPDAIQRVIDTHLAAGSTTMLASLVTADEDTLVRQIEALRPFVADGRLAGIHLEGPFLSERRKGAHDPALLTAPEPGLLHRLIAAAGDDLAMVTLAPELDHALAAIEDLTAAGVVAAIGHTDTDATGAEVAIAAGATVATHLFNAMPSIHHREPGPVPPLLTDPRVTVELVADGIHLAGEVLDLAIATAGPDRVALVTDAMAAAGAADGDYILGALQVQVRDGVARLVTDDGSPGSIAGSTLTMAAAVERLVGRGHDLSAVATMAATTPARRHRLGDVGELAPGRWCDAVLVDAAGRLRQVWRHGVGIE